MFSPKLIISPLNYNNINLEKSESPTSTTSSYFNLSTNNTNHYAQQLKMNADRKYSISEAIRLASQANMKHDANGCCSCDSIVGYYMTALKSICLNEFITCTKELFDLIWSMTNLVLSHRETNRYQHLSWFDKVTLELWEFAKRLKEESYECDLHIPMQGFKYSRINSSDSDASSGDEDNNEESYRRSIRITIYNCRALVYEQSNEFSQAIIYYRKCASVRPTLFESQQHLQQSALLTIQRLQKLLPTPPNLKQRPAYSSLKSSDSVSSASSISSKSSVCCTQCGIEKLVMPVCAKCKSQPYCSVRCMKSHQPVHALVCCFKSF